MAWLKWLSLGSTWLGFGSMVYMLTDEDKGNDPTAEVLSMQFMQAFRATMDAAGVKEIDDEWTMQVTPHFTAIVKATMAKTSSP